LSYLANTQTNKQTRQKDEVWRKHNLLGGGNKLKSSAVHYDVYQTHVVITYAVKKYRPMSIKICGCYNITATCKKISIRRFLTTLVCLMPKRWYRNIQKL